MAKRTKVAYAASRLTFRRDSIEPLDPAERFRVETPAGVFEMSKREFHDVFHNVVRSASYADRGVYNYSTLPGKALQFRVDATPMPTLRRTSRSRIVLPSALEGQCTEEAYKRWLHRKAQAHVKRDKKRWGIDLSVADYKAAIHKAVEEDGLHDAYTGELMDWSLISKYDNKDSKGGGTGYKRGFARLPTVDHATDVPGDMRFQICCWRTNDAKSDMSYEEFVSLCRAVLEHREKKRLRE